MSLINDALKRAKENQPATTPAPAPDKPMQPVDAPVEEPRRRGLPPYFVPAALIVLCGACWFLLQGWEAKRQAGAYPEPVTIHAREPEPAAATSTPKIVQPSPEDLRKMGVDESAIAEISSSVGGASAQAAGATNANSTVTVAEVRPQPPFKLQGIFYRVNNPSAMINSKTVFIGDTIDHAQVKAIDRQSVTLVQDGQTQVLTLY